MYNSLAALAVGEALGFPLKNVIGALEQVSGIAGRFQTVPDTKESPYVSLPRAEYPAKFVLDPPCADCQKSPHNNH